MGEPSGALSSRHSSVARGRVTKLSIDNVVETCRALAPTFGERAATYDREGRFPVESFSDLKDAGLLGVMVPLDQGGLGCDFLTYTRAMEQLGKGDASLALAFNMHNIVMGSLSELDLSRLPKRRGKRQLDFVEWAFAEAVSNGRVFASATSEPGIGASFSRLQTRYEHVDGGYVLNGTKAFVSMAGFADYYVVAARGAETAGEAAGGLLLRGGSRQPGTEDRPRLGHARHAGDGVQHDAPRGLLRPDRAAVPRLRGDGAAQDRPRTALARRQLQRRLPRDLLGHPRLRGRLPDRRRRLPGVEGPGRRRPRASTGWASWTCESPRRGRWPTRPRAPLWTTGAPKPRTC